LIVTAFFADLNLVLSGNGGGMTMITGRAVALLKRGGGARRALPGSSGELLRLTHEFFVERTEIDSICKLSMRGEAKCKTQGEGDR